MGICAGVSLPTGIHLANAYIALATNHMTLQPRGNASFTVQTAYSTWASFDARKNNKAPVRGDLLRFGWDSANSDHVVGNTGSSALYTASYANLKHFFPGCIDCFEI